LNTGDIVAPLPNAVSTSACVTSEHGSGKSTELAAADCVEEVLPEFELPEFELGEFELEAF
jgi:hypothetical protein